MFDPLLSQSIQRWENEGGRVPPATKWDRRHGRHAIAGAHECDRGAATTQTGESDQVSGELEGNDVYSKSAGPCCTSHLLQGTV